MRAARLLYIYENQLRINALRRAPSTNDELGTNDDDSDSEIPNVKMRLDLIWEVRCRGLGRDSVRHGREVRALGKRSTSEMEASCRQRGREGRKLIKVFALEGLIREPLAREGVKSDPAAAAIRGLMHEAVDCWAEWLKRERLRFGGVFPPRANFELKRRNNPRSSVKRGGSAHSRSPPVEKCRCSEHRPACSLT